MLIIGHRGAAGRAPENTMSSFEAAFKAGADMIELDVRLTADNRLVVIHDSRLLRTHHLRDLVANVTYERLRKLTVDRPVPLLEEILDIYFGRILLNIELKSRGSGEQLVRLLKKHYIAKASDWDKVIVSSFRGSELVQVRQLAKRANLALLHSENPFIFVAYHRFINLTAVGFHRLYLTRLALEIARCAGIFIYVYTVDRPGALRHLEEKGVQGVVTNYPDKLIAATE